jgi:hypothetical protein
MNLNESKIIYPENSIWFAKKELLGNKNYLIATVITKNTQKNTVFFAAPPKNECV